MFELGFVGMSVVIPVTLILTLSYFVLLSIRKLDTKSNRLKAFGYVIVSLLWLSAAIVLTTGAYSMMTGKCSMKDKVHKMMKGKKYHSDMKGPMHSEKAVR